jgi:valyl-tRNA synthetase
MYKDWTLPFKTNIHFKKSYQKIDWLIDLISSIRSSKVDLDVSPGSFIEVSLVDLKKEKKDIINNNLSVFKRLARVTKVHSSSIRKKGVNIIVGMESVTLYFDKDVNLEDQKLKIFKKIKDLDNKVISLVQKLENKSFLANAPKSIIKKEKNSLLQYNTELKKLNSILNSIKN